MEPSSKSGREINELAKSICALIHELREDRAERKQWCEFKDAISDLITCIREGSKTMAASIQDLINAGTTLSTAADALSVKTDTLVVAAEAVIAALKGTAVPPGVQKAVDDLKAAATKAAATGDRLDTEVTNLDAVLPQPAPAAPATP